MNLNYRGHEIRISREGHWSVELVEIETGAVLPTKVTAPVAEELIACVDRARSLVDLYVDAQQHEPSDLRSGKRQYHPRLRSCGQGG